MKHQLHKLIAFWSGLVVIAFTCWAWHDSVSWGSSVRKGGWILGSHRSGIFLSHVAAPTQDWEAMRNPLATVAYSRDYFLPPYLVRGSGLALNATNYSGYRNELDASTSLRQEREIAFRYHSSKAWSAFAPYWLVLLVIVVMWAGLLVWRGWRRKQKMTNAELPNEK